MRVLVADQEPEMLEAVARAFEVDVATSKATCIDLLRANHFDVIVACERLSDGSGLELLSHVGQRWPHVIRILAIEPARRSMLRGRLGPFKLFETLSYPIDEDKLEAALTRAAEAIAENESAAPTAEPAPAKNPDSTTRNPTPAASPPATTSSTPGWPAAATQPYTPPVPTAPAAPRNQAMRNQLAKDQIAQQLAAKDDARRAGPRTGAAVLGSRNVPPPSQDAGSKGPGRSGSPASAAAKRAPQSPPPQGLAPNARKPGGEAPPAYPPLPAKGSKIVPLGSTVAGDYKILPHDYHGQSMPGTPRAQREAEKAQPTLQEKAAALASEAMAAVSRYIKPQSSKRPPPKATPGKKR